MDTNNNVATENQNVRPKWSKTAIIGFIISFIGILLLLGISTFGILPLAGLILGIVSTRKINRNKGKLRGKGFSITSIVLGGLGLIFPLWLSIAFIWAKIIQLRG